MTPNPYKPTDFDRSDPETKPSTRSVNATARFVIAGLAAVFLLIAYMIGFGWIAVGSILEVNPVTERPMAITILLWVAFYATLIQLPIYLVWALISRELNVREREIWFAGILLLNMFAIPVFLVAKYRRRTSAWLTRYRIQRSIAKNGCATTSESFT